MVISHAVAVTGSILKIVSGAFSFLTIHTSLLLPMPYSMTKKKLDTKRYKVRIQTNVSIILINPQNINAP